PLRAPALAPRPLVQLAPSGGPAEERDAEMCLTDYRTCGLAVLAAPAVLVGGREDRVHVRRDIVVCVDGLPPLRCVGEIPAATQVIRGGERGIEDVVDISDAVAVTVDRLEPPRGGDELHGADSSIVDSVEVQFAPVGVGDEHTSPLAVQRQSD